MSEIMCRMHQNVLGGRLWYKECQDANQDLPDQLPLNYESSQQYVSTFEPLMFEEAREAVRSSWVETCDMKNTFTVDVTRYTGCPVKGYTHQAPQAIGTLQRMLVQQRQAHALFWDAAAAVTDVRPMIGSHCLWNRLQPCHHQVCCPTESQ